MTIKDSFYKYCENNRGKFAESEGLFIYFKGNKLTATKQIFRITGRLCGDNELAVESLSTDGMMFPAKRNNLVKIPSKYWLNTYSSMFCQEQFAKAKDIFKPIGTEAASISEKKAEEPFIMSANQAKRAKLHGLYRELYNPCSEIFIKTDKSSRKGFIGESITPYIDPYDFKLKQPTKEKVNIMAKIKDRNITAATAGAKIAAGKAINAVVMAKIKPQLPMMVRGYADSPLAAIVVANVFSAGVDQFMPQNARARQVADVMLDSAMTEFFSNFNIEKMFAELVASADIPEMLDPEDTGEDKT